MNRNSTQIMGEILEVSQEAVPTSTIIRSVNLPHPRFKSFVSKLVQSGLLVKIKNNYVITENGRIYLAEYKRFYNFASDFGMEL